MYNKNYLESLFKRFPVYKDISWNDEKMKIGETEIDLQNIDLISWNDNFVLIELPYMNYQLKRNIFKEPAPAGKTFDDIKEFAITIKDMCKIQKNCLFHDIEELAELIAAISKLNDMDNIVEEIADVEVSLSHLKSIFEISDKVLTEIKKSKGVYNKYEILEKKKRNNTQG